MSEESRALHGGVANKATSIAVGLAWCVEPICTV